MTALFTDAQDLNAEGVYTNKEGMTLMIVELRGDKGWSRFSRAGSRINAVLIRRGAEICTEIKRGETLNERVRM